MGRKGGRKNKRRKQYESRSSLSSASSSISYRESRKNLSVDSRKCACSRRLGAEGTTSKFGLLCGQQPLKSYVPIECKVICAAVSGGTAAGEVKGQGLEHNGSFNGSLKHEVGLQSNGFNNEAVQYNQVDSTGVQCKPNGLTPQKISLSNLPNHRNQVCEWGPGSIIVPPTVLRNRGISLVKDVKTRSSAGFQSHQLPRYTTAEPSSKNTQTRHCCSPALPVSCPENNKLSSFGTKRNNNNLPRRPVVNATKDGGTVICCSKLPTTTTTKVKKLKPIKVSADVPESNPGGEDVLRKSMESFQHGSNILFTTTPKSVQNTETQETQNPFQSATNPLQHFTSDSSNKSFPNSQNTGTQYEDAELKENKKQQPTSFGVSPPLPNDGRNVCEIIRSCLAGADYPKLPVKNQGVQYNNEEPRKIFRNINVQDACDPSATADHCHGLREHQRGQYETSTGGCFPLEARNGHRHYSEDLEEEYGHHHHNHRHHQSHRGGNYEDSKNNQYHRDRHHHHRKNRSKSNDSDCNRKETRHSCRSTDRLNGQATDNVFCELLCQKILQTLYANNTC